MISEGTWRTRFGADEGILGKTMQLNGRTFEIIGVLPRQAEFPNSAALWIPLAGDPNQQGSSYSFSGVGRLKPGVTPELAEQDLHRVQEAIWTARDKERLVSPLVMPLRENFVSQFEDDGVRAVGSRHAPADRRLRQRRGGDARTRDRAPA